MTSKKRKPAPVQKSKRSNPIWVGYLFLILGLGAYLALVVHFNFTQDDAYITFRYAANYLDGHGLVYNIGERVEGYTNFLWTIFMIMAGLAGIDFVIISKILGALFGSATIIILFLLSRRVFQDLPRPRAVILAGITCFVFGTAYSSAYWAVAGLETAAFGFMVVLSLYSYVRRSLSTVPCLVAATLFRPEGALVFACVIGYDIIKHRALTRYAILNLVVYSIFLIPFAVFKLTYYGSLFPNPFYAKTAFDFQQVVNGLSYTGQFLWHYLAAGIFVVPALILIKRTPSALRAIMVFLLIYTLYIILIGGDVLKVHRFFVPILPLFAVTVIYGFSILFEKKAFLLVLAVVVLIGWQVTLPRKHVTTFHTREVGFTLRMADFSDALVKMDSTNFSLAVSTIGLVGYRLLDHTIIDMLGLADSTIARHPEPYIEGMETTWRETHFNSSYLLSRRPDYILFSTGAKPSAPAERALFLYTDFLNSYRTIGFFLGTKLQSIYKRYYQAKGEIRRDVDVRFVQYYNRGMNLLNKDNAAAGAAFDSAAMYCPQPTYPYLYYYMSEAQRKTGNIELSYQYLKQAAAMDSLVYEVDKDLYLYEYMTGNYERAMFHRARVAKIVPWYMPRLDSLVLGNQQR